MDNYVDSNVDDTINDGGSDTLSLHNNRRNGNRLNNSRISNNNSSNATNNPRRLRGNRLGNNVRNNQNNNPMSRNSNQNKSGVQNNGVGKRNSRLGSGGGVNRNKSDKISSNEQNDSSNDSLTKKNSTSSSTFSGKQTNSFTGESSSEESTEVKLRIKVPLVLKIKIALVVVVVAAIILGFLFLVGCVVVFFGGGVSSTGTLTPKDKYCKELEVTFCSEESTKDNCIPDTELVENGVKTYDLETYVAGVVTGEIGHFKNDDTLKALAVAARTYVLYHTNNGKNCQVKSWANFQVMNPNPIQRAVQAAKDTEGETLYGDNGKLINAMYDAFACYEKDDEYYYIMQGNMIPIDWAKEAGVPEEWTSCKIDELPAHGEGLSQYGAYYLAEMRGYNYHDILRYYYSDQIQGFSCEVVEVEGSCSSEDEECEVEYEKVCTSLSGEDNDGTQ